MCSPSWFMCAFTRARLPVCVYLACLPVCSYFVCLPVDVYLCVYLACLPVHVYLCVSTLHVYLCVLTMHVHLCMFICTFYLCVFTCACLPVLYTPHKPAKGLKCMSLSDIHIYKDAENANFVSKCSLNAQKSQ